MKRFTLLLYSLLFSHLYISAQTAVAPIGNGTQSVPYQIASLNNLYWLASNSGEWGKHYIQTADIDASATSSWTGSGWVSIGNSSHAFTGTYNGQKHSISNLYLNTETENSQGLFGSVNQAIIKQLRLQSISITGISNIGGICGYAISSEITECGVDGNISGTSSVGGITGGSSGTLIKNCYSLASVASSSFSGGITGFLGLNSAIAECYSAGKITKSSSNGGLAGKINLGQVVRSYWDEQATGLTAGYGGSLNGIFSASYGKSTSQMKEQATFDYFDFAETVNGETVGIWAISPLINNGYPSFSPHLSLKLRTLNPEIAGSTASVYGQITEMGETEPISVGFVWSNENSDPTMTDNQIELDYSSGNRGFSATIEDIVPNSLYYVKAYVSGTNWVKYGTVVKFETALINAKQPETGDGSSESPYLITSIENLYWISQTPEVWGKNFVQVADIDASPTGLSSDGGLLPIGLDGKAGFTGTYDGAGHVIKDLIIKKSEMNCGLFAQTNGATIKKLGLVNLLLNCNADIGGGLVGYCASTTIEQCFVTGEINIDGYSASTGGLAGQCSGATISDSYVAASVTGVQSVGGIAGGFYNSSLNNCYFTGEAMAGKTAYALTSTNKGVSNCFWDAGTCPSCDSYYVPGTPAKQMLLKETYTDAGWDFSGEDTNGLNDYWAIDKSLNSGFPHLNWQKAGVSYKFKKGWNLLSFHHEISNPATQTVFQPILSNVEIIKTFDGFYSINSPQVLNTINLIETGKGYLVKMTEDVTLTVAAPVLHQTGGDINLKKGWNLIGIPYNQAISVEDALKDISSFVEEAGDFEQSYQTGSNTNTLVFFEPGKAYFIKVTNGCILHFE